MKGAHQLDAGFPYDDFPYTAAVSFFSRLLTALGGNRARRRWSAEELKQRKEELTELCLANQEDVRSTIKVAEYLFQRYLPQDSAFTQRNWTRFKKNALRRLRAAQGAGELTPAKLAARFHAEQQAAEARAELLRSSYTLRLEDFTRVVCQLIASAGLDLRESERSLLFRAVRSHSVIGAFSERVALVSAAKAWGENYELLRRARNAGYEWIAISPAYGCDCRAGVPRHVQKTDEMLRAFEAGRPSELLHPSLTLACLKTPGALVCRQSLHPSDKEILSAPDPRFEDWLEDMARKRRGLSVGETGS